jgi:hypothetical protein
MDLTPRLGGGHRKGPRTRGRVRNRQALLQEAHGFGCLQHPRRCSASFTLPATASDQIFLSFPNLCSAIPENRSFFGRFFSLTTACFFVRSLVSFLSDAGDAGVWLRLRRAMSWRLCVRSISAFWREILFRLAPLREVPHLRLLFLSGVCCRFFLRLCRRFAGDSPNVKIGFDFRKHPFRSASQVIY